MSQQINLFNPIFLKQKKYFSAVTMLQALGLIALGIAFMGAYASFELSRLRPEAKAVSAQLQAAQAQLASVRAQSSRENDPALDAAMRKVEAQVLALQRVTQSLNQDVAGTSDSGYADYMRALARQIRDGIWLTGFSIGAGGNDISISGAAVRPELVPAYLSRLGTEPVMRGKSFNTLEMKSPASEQPAAEPTLVEFRVRTSMEPKATGVNGAAAQ